MSKEELLKKYHELFGADAPEPVHHLKSIIEMINSGDLMNMKICSCTKRLSDKFDVISKL